MNFRNGSGLLSAAMWSSRKDIEVGTKAKMACVYRTHSILLTKKHLSSRIYRVIRHTTAHEHITSTSIWVWPDTADCVACSKYGSFYVMKHVMQHDIQVSTGRGAKDELHNP